MAVDLRVFGESVFYRSNRYFFVVETTRSGDRWCGQSDAVLTIVGICQPSTDVGCRSAAASAGRFLTARWFRATKNSRIAASRGNVKALSLSHSLCLSLSLTLSVSLTLILSLSPSPFPNPIRLNARGGYDVSTSRRRRLSWRQRSPGLPGWAPSSFQLRGDPSVVGRALTPPAPLPCKLLNRSDPDRKLEYFKVADRW